MTRRSLPALSLLLLLPSAACGWSAPPAPPGSTDPGAIRRYLEAVVGAPDGPPSISVAVAVGDGIVLAEAVGHADLETDSPATPQSAYRIYSVTKGVTAVAVMGLVEAGEIRLEDDVRDYLPAFPAKRWPIRVEHLITHTSGIRHYREGAGEISSTVEYPSLADSLVVFADDPLEFEPGTAYGYSSYGFNLLSGVIEEATGESFEGSLKELVLAPAGLERTRLDVAVGEIPEKAAGYQPHWLPWADNRRVGRLPNLSGRYGASGLVSTPSDLVRLFAALHRGRVLRPETFERMASVAFPDLGPRQALGWLSAEREDGRRVLYGLGAGIGYTAAVEYYPVEAVSAALLVNRTPFEHRLEILHAVVDPFLTGSGRPGRMATPAQLLPSGRGE